MNTLATFLLASGDGASLWHALARSISNQLDEQEHQAPIVIGAAVVVVLVVWLNVRLAIRLVRGPKSRKVGHR